MPFFVRSCTIREPFWKARDLLFARLSLCAAFSICEPFWKARNLSLRAILKSAASCFVWVCPKKHINCSSFHLTAIVRYFVQEDLLSHEYSPRRFLMCVASASERVLAEPFWKAPQSPERSSRSFARTPKKQEPTLLAYKKLGNLRSVPIEKKYAEISVSKVYILKSGDICTRWNIILALGQFICFIPTNLIKCIRWQGSHLSLALQ